MTNIPLSLSDCLDSKVARLHLFRQIEERWGKQIADSTDPDDIKTFSQWVKAGYRIRPQERSLEGVIFIPTRNQNPDTKTVRKPLPVRLFHRRQVRSLRY